MNLGNGPVCPENQQSYQSPLTAAIGQRFNAMKHGRYAESLFIPGEDPQEFARARRALLHTYRPQTVDEAELVHTIATHAWIKRRLGPQQAAFDAQAATPERDAAGRICEPIAHQREHSGLDVSVRWKRVEFLWNRARAELLASQKLRRQGLVEGAVRLPRDCYMETDGTVYGPIVQREIVPQPEPEIAPQPDTVSASADTADGFAAEQKETGGANPAARGAIEPRTGAEPDAFTAWAALPGEIVVLGFVEAALLPRSLAS